MSGLLAVPYSGNGRSRREGSVSESSGDHDAGDALRRQGVAPAVLDDVDQHLIRLLRADGRMSNRSIATEIGMTESTVATRIRRLIDSNVVAVTAVFDWAAAGYEWYCTAQFRCRGGDPFDLAHDLGEVRGAIAVSVVFGEVDIIGNFLLADRADIQRLTEDLNRIDGLELVDLLPATEQIKYEWAVGTFPINPDPALDFPQPVVELDDVDRDLIRALVADARQSNIEIARQLDVSEGTVRSRLKRLTGAGLLRLSAVVDPVVLGSVAAIAFTYVKADPGAIPTLTEKLADLDECWQMSRVVGRFDFALLIVCQDRRHMVDLIMRRLRTLPGVESTWSVEVADVVHHAYHWVSFVNGHAP